MTRFKKSTKFSHYQNHNLVKKKLSMTLNSTNSTIPSSTAIYLNQLSSKINTNFAIISASIGVPCNLICLVIFWRLTRTNKTNMGMLGIVQSLIDMTILLIYLFNFRGSPLFFTIAPFNRDHLQCKIYTFMRRFFLHASSGMVVLSTFDRFTFVLYGHDKHLKFIKNKLALSGCILILFSIIALFDVPNLMFYVSNGVCLGNDDATISSDIISILIRTYLPFAIMIIFNLLMIRKLFEIKRATLQQNNTLTRKEYQFTLAVIAYDVYFFVLNFPISIYYILYDLNQYSGNLRCDSMLSAKYTFFGAITSNLAVCIQTFSFFMYLGCNKLFRHEFLRLLGNSSRHLKVTSLTITKTTRRKRNQIGAEI